MNKVAALQEKSVCDHAIKDRTITQIQGGRNQVAQRSLPFPELNALEF